jgi:predicted RNA-binding protein YlqC (UPF0109 family)
MTQQSADVRALVEQIAKTLVDEPDQVSVSQLDGDVLDSPSLRTTWAR